MKRYQRRRRIIFGLFLVAVLYIGYLFVSGYMEVRAVRREITVIESAIEETRIQNSALEEKIKDLHSEQYIEQLAREKLGLVKEGEILIRPVFTDPD